MFVSKKDLWTGIITSNRRSLTDLSSNIKKIKPSWKQNTLPYFQPYWLINSLILYNNFIWDSESRCNYLLNYGVFHTCSTQAEEASR